MKLFAIATVGLMTAGAALAQEAPTQIEEPGQIQKSVGDMAQSAQDAAAAAGEAASDAASDAAEAAGKAADAAGEAVDQAGAAAAQAVDDAGKAASDATNAAGDAAKNAADAASDAAADAANKAADAAAKAADSAAEAMNAAETEVIPPDVAAPAISADAPGMLSSWLTSRKVWTTGQPSGTPWTEPELAERPTEWADIAKVDDVVMDDEGRVVGYVADIGGFLGIGAKKVLLGIDAIHLTRVGDEWLFATNFTKEELQSLPDFDQATVLK